jgi:hypothetical protein
MEKRNDSKRAWKIAKNSLLALAVAGFGVWSVNRTLNNYTPLSEQDYKNAKWYSSSATPNEAYNFENITHNRVSKNFYFNMIKKKNGSLEKAHLYPDLDRNGKVAQ